MAATVPVQGMELAFLRRGSHTIEDLTQRALGYIECEILEWSETQTIANVYLNNFLHDSDARSTWQSAFLRDPKLGSDIIAQIGDLFLLGGLKDVVFQFERDMAVGHQDLSLGSSRSIEGVGEVIRFNAAHAVFQSTPTSDKGRLFLSVALHESVHAFFKRFARPAISYTGHHYGFQLVAAAIERKASYIFGLEFDLFRRQAFIYESRIMNRISLTEEQMAACFDDQFFSLRDINILLNNGAPIPGIAPDDRCPHNPSSGPARYPMWSKGPGRDFLLVDLPSTGNRTGNGETGTRRNDPQDLCGD
jgi:hypothetical protein